MADKQTLDRCLAGVTFPADGGTIAEHASFNSCPSDVVAGIRGSSARAFSTEEEVLCTLGASTYC